MWILWVSPGRASPGLKATPSMWRGAAPLLILEIGKSKNSNRPSHSPLNNPKLGAVPLLMEGVAFRPGEANPRLGAIPPPHGGGGLQAGGGPPGEASPQTGFSSTLHF